MRYDLRGNASSPTKVQGSRVIVPGNNFGGGISPVQDSKL